MKNFSVRSEFDTFSVEADAFRVTEAPVNMLIFVKNTDQTVMVKTDNGEEEEQTITDVVAVFKNWDSVKEV